MFHKKVLFSLVIMVAFVQEIKAQIFQGSKVSQCAISIINPAIVYDPTYYCISYPNGDVKPSIGVCTDVVIRTYRKLNIDLQQLVYEDMKKNPARYNYRKPDKNIAHRRVPNLMVYFKNYGKEIFVSQNKGDYQAGDIVCWEISSGINHIGIVTHLKDSKTGNPMVVHNIGHGQVLEDCLFSFKQIGHYRY